MDARPRIRHVLSLVVLCCATGMVTSASAQAGSISGTVTDDSLGAAPVQDICVYAFDSVDGSIPGGVRGGPAVTGPDGSYSISGLNDGSYKLVYTNLSCPVAGPPIDTEWFMDKPDHGSANVVQVIAGSAPAANAAVHLSTPPSGTGSISGHLADGFAVDLEGVCVRAFDVGSETTVVASTTSNADGDYTVSGLPAGSYKLEFSTAGMPPCAGPSADLVVTEWYSDAADFASADPVAVTADTDTPGTDATLDRSADGGISGHVTNGVGDNLAGICAVAYTAASGGPPAGFSGAVFTDSNGNYSIASLPPDSYRVLFTTVDPCPGPEVADEWWQNKADFANANAVVVSAGSLTANTDGVLDARSDAVDDSATVAEDSGANTIDVRGNDTDPDGPKDLITATTDGTHGTVARTNGDTDVSYTPAVNYCGPDSFTYTLGGADTANVSVTVTCVNDAPTNSVPGAQTTDEDTPKTLSGANAISVTDSDAGSDPLEVDLSANHGKLTLGATAGLTFSAGDGTADAAMSFTGTQTAIDAALDGLTYDPDPNYNGPDTLSITTDDQGSTGSGGAMTDTDTVAVTVSAVDDDPVAVDDAKTVAEDATATAIDVRANDTDVDGGPKTIASRTNAGHGAVTITNSGDDLTYQPIPDYCGPDAFTYTLNGGSTATVNVTVTCVDDNPVAVDDSKTVAEDSGATTIDVLANDTDVDAGPKTIGSKTNGAHGVVSITGGGNDLTYTPDADYCGPDAFTYTLNGGSTATVNVTVTCVDDNPVAVDDSKTVAEDSGATTIDVLANDTDVDAGPKTIASKTNGGHGQVAITGGGNDLTYTPDADYCGPDAFTYTLNGGSTATVNVTVTCVDDVTPDTQAPDTQISKSPMRKVKTKKSKVSVRFAFSSTEPGSTFTCKLDNGPAAACSSPISYTVKAGRHTFVVIATDAAGNADATPARASFKVIRKRH